jgi:hypothetical protein
VQVLRVDWPVYPRRAEHNTVAEGGNTRSAVASSSRIRRWPCSLASASLAHAAERERPGNRLERLGADREADHSGSAAPNWAGETSVRIRRLIAGRCASALFVRAGIRQGFPQRALAGPGFRSGRPPFWTPVPLGPLVSGRRSARASRQPPGLPELRSGNEARRR